MQPLTNRMTRQRDPAGQAPHLPLSTELLNRSRPPWPLGPIVVNMADPLHDSIVVLYAVNETSTKSGIRIWPLPVVVPLVDMDSESTWPLTTRVKKSSGFSLLRDARVECAERPDLQLNCYSGVCKGLVQTVNLRARLRVPGRYTRRPKFRFRADAPIEFDDSNTTRTRSPMAQTGHPTVPLTL